MSRSARSVPKESENLESFEERVENLFEELSRSIKYERPSILLLPYTSEFIRSDVEAEMRARLAAINQRLISITVTSQQFDLPLMLSRRIDRRESVFSVLGLSRGGGTRNANAYKALNMRRELLVDYDIRALFWLNKAESRSLSRIAPDFWAFRHRVIDFSFARDLDERILKGGRLALRQCRQAARLSPEDPSAWLSLGKTNLQLGLLEEARKAFERVLWLVPDHPRAWHGLGDVYRLGKQTTDAIINYRQAARLDPSFLPAQFSLIACYRLVALTDLAAEQIEVVRPSVKNESEYAQAVFASVSGNITEAVDLLTRAIELHQGSPDQIRRDPNLDFIRSEPRFLQLISRF